MKEYSMEYIIGSIGPRAFTVTKFEIHGSGEPLEQYAVDFEKQQGECNCPAWKSGKTRPCKHIRMVQQYVEAGEPAQEDYRIVGIGKDWVFSINRRPCSDE